MRGTHYRAVLVRPSQIDADDICRVQIATRSSGQPVMAWRRITHARALDGPGGTLLTFAIGTSSQWLDRSYEEHELIEVAVPR